MFKCCKINVYSPLKGEVTFFSCVEIRHPRIPPIYLFFSNKVFIGQKIMSCTGNVLIVHSFAYDQLTNFEKSYLAL